MLAMARPWQEYVAKFSLVDAFVKNNIGMILNLQEVGEHDNCGPGNLPKSGFTYDPDSFMAAQIGFYNFSWRDMGVPDLDRMMDIVQVWWEKGGRWCRIASRSPSPYPETL
jgi:protein tyrosine phosphatase domain-containing protein 1